MKKKIQYAIVHNQEPPFQVYSEVNTNFGGIARNWVKDCETYEEAKNLVERLKKMESE